MKRLIRVEGEVAFVPLTQGYEAIIDAADASLVHQCSWRVLIQRRPDGSIKCLYAIRYAWNGGTPQTRRMHREIMGAPIDALIDHVNGNGLDNRRANLRWATDQQNKHNARVRIDSTSGVKGVCWSKHAGKWRAQIGLHGKKISLGYFANLADAQAAYARASKEFHGEFGRTQ